MYKIVIADTFSSKAEIMTIQHKDNLIGLNVVALLEGNLCGCEWCNNLINRINSRTINFNN